MWKRFEIPDGTDTDVTLIDKVTGREYTDNFEDIVEVMNELDTKYRRVNDRLKRQMKRTERANKDVRKYTDYFMRELGWDCDRIVEEVFR